MNIFRKECLGKPEDVTLMILQEWLEGKGLPVTWGSLIKALKDAELFTMADQIQNKSVDVLQVVAVTILVSEVHVL